MKVYLIKTLKAPMALECGVRASLNEPKVNPYYETEVIAEADLPLPGNFHSKEYFGYTSILDDYHSVATLVTEKDEDNCWCTQLVTENLAVDWHHWKDIQKREKEEAGENNQ